MEKSNNLPLYVSIKEDIYNQIENGIYKDKEMLPPENELAAFYKVSRVTIRKALEELTKHGIIERQAGFGTTIKKEHKDLKLFTMVKSFTNEMKDSGQNNISTISSTISIVFADENLMNKFNCKFSEKIYNLKRVRGVNGKPIVFSDTWLRLPIDLPTDREFLFGSLYNYLISKNVVFSKFEEELEAVAPSKTMKDILNLDKDGVVLKRVRQGFDPNGQLIEYTDNYYDAKMYKYSVEVASIEKVK